MGSRKGKDSKTKSKTANANPYQKTNDNKQKLDKIGLQVFQLVRFLISLAVFVFVSASMAGATCFSNLLARSTVIAVNSAPAQVNTPHFMLNCTASGFSSPKVLLFGFLSASAFYILLRYMN